MAIITSRRTMAEFYAYAVVAGLLVPNVLRKRRSRQSQQSKLDEPALDRHGQSSWGRPNKPLPEGVYFLVHSATEKVLTWSMLGAITVLTLVGIYFVCSASGVGGELYIISVGGLCGWAGALYLRSVFLSPQLNSSAVNLLRPEAALRMRAAATRESAIHDRAVDDQ